MEALLFVVLLSHMVPYVAMKCFTPRQPYVDELKVEVSCSLVPIVICGYWCMLLMHRCRASKFQVAESIKYPFYFRQLAS